LEASDRRELRDRRNKPTPPLSRYTFFGRRKTIRRRSERQPGGYVDRYSSVLFFMLVLMMGLNILDSLFTMMILDSEGWEANPIVQSVIQLHGDRFWIWKFLLVSFCLVLLCLHSRFRLIKGVLLALSMIYLVIILYQLFLLIHI
jgi:Domain of unknown function (DUF5658)